MGNIIKKAVSKVLYDFADKDTEEKVRYRFSKKYKKIIDTRLATYNKYLEIIEHKEKQNPIVIVFICQVPALWNTVASIYEEATKDSRVKPYIIAIPEKIMAENYNIDAENYGKNEAYDYCTKIYGNKVINGYNDETKTFFDIRSLDPTYVCLPRPYDMHVPPEYRSTEICKYAKLFFLPYGYTLCKWDVKMVYNIEFLSSVYAIYADNKYSADMVERSFGIYDVGSKKRVFNLGYPAFDHYKGRQHTFDHNYKATVLWMPRWTTNKEIEATTFFKYKDSLIKYFKDHPDIKFIFRPHPLMLRNYVSCNLMTLEEEEQLLKDFETFPNFVYDNNGDYTLSLLSANIIISDYSSLLMHALIMEVPVIYTGKTSNFNSYIKKTEEGMYIVPGEKQLFDTLENLLKGNDLLVDKHKKVRKLLADDDFNAGKLVLNSLIEDYSK